MTNKSPNSQEQLSRLQAVVEAVHETLTSNDLDTALYTVVAGVRKVVSEAASAAITLVDSKGQLDPNSYRVAGPLTEIMTSEKPRFRGGIGAWVVEHNEAIFEENVATGEAKNHPSIRKERAPVGAYACVPLPSDHKVTGTLFVIFPTPFHFSDDVKESLNSFASLAARAVELTRLREESEQQKNQQAQTMRQVSQKLLETWQQSDPISALDITLADILRQVDEEVISDQAISAVIYIYEEGEGFYRGTARGPLREYMDRYPPRKGGTGEYVIQTKEPIFVSDVANMPPGVPPLSPLAIEQGVKAFANLPLLIGQVGQEALVGILVINLQETYNFDENRQAILRLFADQAAIALQNARVHRRRLREQEALQAISESETSGEPGEVGQIIAKQAIELTKSTYATLWSADLARTQLELRGAYQTDPQWRPPKTTLPIDESSINGHVAHTKAAYYAPNLAVDPYYARWHRGIKAALCVPLLIRKELIGTLYVANEKENGIALADQDFIKRLAPHAAAALYNVKLFQLEQEQRRQSETLRRVAQIVNSTLEPKEVIGLVLDQLGKVIEYDSASVQLIQGERRILVGGRGFLMGDSPPELLRNVSRDPLVSKIVQEQRPIVLSNVKDELLWDHISQTAGVNSWIGVPLVVRGQVIGLLTVDHKQAGYYTHESGEIVAAFANQVAVAIRNAELYSTEQRRSRDLEVLNQSAVKLAKTLQAEQTYQAILDAVIAILACDYCTIFLAQVDNTLNSSISGGSLFAEMPKLRFAPGEGLAGWVYQQGQPLLIPNTAEDKRYKLGPWEKEIKPRSMILAPLSRGETIIGVVSADFDDPEAFDEDDLRLLDTLVLHAGTVLQNIEFFNEFQVLHDAANNLAKQPTLEQIYQTAVQSSLEILHCRHSTIFILDRKVGELVAMARVGSPQGASEVKHFKPGEGLAGVAVKTGKPILVNNATNDERFIESKIMPRSAPRSVILAPIKIEDEVMGILSGDKDEINGFTEHNLAMLETLALDVGIAINLRRQQDMLQAITEFQRDISDILPVQEQLKRIHEKMSGLMDTSNMFIALYDEDTAIIRFPLVYERGQLIKDELKIEGRLYSARQLGERRGLTEWVFRHKQSLLIENFDTWLEGKQEVEEDFRQDIKCCLLVPALIKDKIIGVIGLQSFDQPNIFDETHRNLLEIIASQAAIAIHNTSLFQQVNDQMQALTELNKLTQQLISIEESSQDPRNLLEQIAKSAYQVLKADLVDLYEYLPATKEYRLPQIAVGERRGPLVPKDKIYEDDAVFQLIHRLTPLYIENVQSDPMLSGPYTIERVTQPKERFTVREGLQSTAAIPLRTGHETVGLMFVSYRTPQKFGIEQREIIELFANQAAIAIRNARLYDLINNQLRRRIKELEAISKLQQKISTVGSVEEQLQAIYDATAEAMSGLMDTRNMYIALYDENTAIIEFPLVYEKGEPVPDEKKVEKVWVPRRFGERRGLTEWVIHHKEALLIGKNFERSVTEKDIQAFAIGTKCWLGAPMLLRDKVIGVIGMQNFEQEGVFDEHHRDLLVTIVGQAAIAIENAKILERREKELKAISEFQQKIITLGLSQPELQN